MDLSKKRDLTTIDLPSELRGRFGIFAAPFSTISLDKSSPGYALCVQDETKNIIDLSRIKDVNLHVKVGCANTSYGMIIFILFIFWDTRKEKDKFTYEVLLNPNDMRSYEQYLMLDKEKEWEVLVVESNKVIDIFQFDNIYNILNSRSFCIYELREIEKAASASL